MAQANQTQTTKPTNGNANVDTFTVHTAKREGQKAVETKLTFNWAGVSETQLRDLARRALVINWQRMARTGDEPIPAEDTVSVLDMINGTGRRARTITPERVLSAVGDDVSKAEAMVKALQAKIAEAKKAAK